MQEQSAFVIDRNEDNMQIVHVIGAGLAGSEAAWQLARRGIPVVLHEAKPVHFSPAHHNPGFAELVCSNSLRSDRVSNAVGLLKAEMRLLSSLILEAAEASRVPAGGALAVDRTRFSAYITGKLEQHPLITIIREEVTELPKDGIKIIATGPLTLESLAGTIAEMTGEDALSFYDAAAPIVTRDSIDMTKAFRQSRYGRGEDDYINCPMTKEEYDVFYQALINADTAPVHGFEDKNVFEGCMPVEVMAKRGYDTLCYGPLKPVGLIDPRNGRRPFAVVQLRQDDAEDTMYNIVGFQTRLKFPEQKRVFGLIPGLEKAEYVRYGVMHRNTFLQSPLLLTSLYRLRNREDVYFAGQITGVEGYVESAGSGLLCALGAAYAIQGKTLPDLAGTTCIGSMGRYVSLPNRDFQPMNASFGLMDPLPVRIRNKQERCEKIAQRSLDYLQSLLESGKLE